MLVNNLGVPGLGALLQSVEKRLIWGHPQNILTDQVILDSTTVDARSTVTTELLPGLCLGRITSTKKHKQYSPTATDGTQFEQVALLAHPVNMLDPRTAVAADRLATVVIAGAVKNAECGGLDDLFRQLVFGRIVFDDVWNQGGFGGWRGVFAKTADYTVVAADNGKIFTNRGAAGAVNFTLPTLAKGLRFRFFVEADQTLTITAAAADTLVVFNDLAADSIAASTAGEKIGWSAEVIANDNATKWLVIESIHDAQTSVIAT